MNDTPEQIAERRAAAARYHEQERQKTFAKRREEFSNGKLVKKGMVYGWQVSPDDYRPLMRDILQEFVDAGCAITPAEIEATNAARAAQVTEQLAGYRKAQANKSPEQKREELAMMRGAYGAGKTVVDVFTGEKFRT